ncbi:MAG: alpha/beta hydrolase [Pirellulales bacterium]
MDGRWWRRLTGVMTLLAVCASLARATRGNAEEMEARGRTRKVRNGDTAAQGLDMNEEKLLPLNMNIVMPTMGGKQLWTDEWIHGDYRIQRNVLTGHYRLLDDQDQRLAWGTLGQCQTRFAQVRQERSLAPLSGKVVILLHGLGRSRVVMAGIADYLRKEGGYTPIAMNYASTREGVDRHAAALAKVIQHLSESSEVTELNFVAHSLGNIVLRHYLADCEREQVEANRLKVHRIVMLGPPNNGAEIARKLHATGLFGVVVGPSGKALGNDWESLVGDLATPKCEFGIIAGGRGDEKGNNPLLSGDDDLVVTVEETRLEGAADFLLASASHSGLLKDQNVHAATLRFLREGHFRAQGMREPIRGGNAK